LWGVLVALKCIAFLFLVFLIPPAPFGKGAGGIVFFSV